MDPQNYYFTLTPCNNGWIIKQFEWAKNNSFEITYSLVFSNLCDAMEKLSNMASYPTSFIKAYE